MNDKTQDSTQYILVTGMHRSHTSVICNWLHDCGLPFYGNLIPASYDNPKGYFENILIRDFHNQFLMDQNVGLYPSAPPQIVATHKQVVELQQIVQRVSESEVSAIKDPRISLLWESLWEKAVTKPYYIFIVREPEQVIFSLMRRLEREVQNTTGLFGLYLRAKWPWSKQKWKKRFTKATLVHNHSILRAMQTLPTERFVLLSSQDCENYAEKIIDKINQNLKLDLEVKPFSSVFETTLTKQAPTDFLSNEERQQVQKQFLSFSEFRFS